MLTFEPGKLGVDLVEANTIAAIVSIAMAKGQVAVRKSVGDDFSDLSDLVVLRGRADIEDLLVNEVSRRFENASDGMSYILDMDQGPPGAAITGHPYLFGCPRKTREIVENNIETH